MEGMNIAQVQVCCDVEEEIVREIRECRTFAWRTHSRALDVGQFEHPVVDAPGGTILEEAALVLRRKFRH